MAQTSLSPAICVPFSQLIRPLDAGASPIAKRSDLRTDAALSSSPQELPSSPRKQNQVSAALGNLLPAPDLPVLPNLGPCAAQTIYSSPPPPPATAPWTWACYRCGTKHRLSCTQRCLECSRARRREGKTAKPKPSEFDFAGWRDYNAWRSEVAFMTSLRSSSSSASLSSLSSSSTASYSTTSTHASAAGCEVACDYPGECKRRRTLEAARRKREMEDRARAEEEEEKKRKEEEQLQQQHQQKRVQEQEQEDDHRWWTEIVVRDDGSTPDGMEGCILSRAPPFGQLSEKNGADDPPILPLDPMMLAQGGPALGDANTARIAMTGDGEDKDKDTQVRQAVVLALGWPCPAFTLSPPSSSASSTCSETWYDEERDDADYAACEPGPVDSEKEEIIPLQGQAAEEGGRDVDMDDSPRPEPGLVSGNTGQAEPEMLRGDSLHPISSFLGLGVGDCRPARDAEMELDDWLNTIEDPHQGDGTMDGHVDMF